MDQFAVVDDAKNLAKLQVPPHEQRNRSSLVRRFTSLMVDRFKAQVARLRPSDL